MPSILDDVQVHLVSSIDDLDDFRRWLGERRPVLGADTETTGLSLGHDKIRLVQFGDAQQGWALPYEEWRGAIRWVLETYEGPTVWHHAKFDAGMLQRDGLTFPWSRVHDTQMMCFLVNSLGPKGLKPASALYLDPSAQAGAQALGNAMKRNGWDWATVPIDHPLYWGYGAIDTVLTARLAEHLWPHVQQFRTAYDLEMACERVLTDMELRGVRVDVEYCEQAKAELELRLMAVMERLRVYDVNPNTPTDVARALEERGAELTKRTEKGNLAVDDEVLTHFAKHGLAVASDVLEARWLGKMIKTYFRNFLKYHVDEILHPHINQLAAKTGRMSVTDPPLQTIPKKSLLRDAFIPRDGNALVLVDYDNEELRMAAHFTGDEAMLAAFREGRDLHAETARRLYGDDFTREQRGTAKNSIFAKAYGAAVERFAQAAGIPPAEAAAVFAVLDQLYPGLGRTMAKVSAAVRARAGRDQLGWVELIDGRHLRVQADKAYVGFNALIQGSCAVVLKRALVDLDNAGLGEYLVLPVHDEVAFDVPLPVVDEVVPEIKRVMTREDFRAPLTVGAKVVSRWGDPYREQAA